MKIGIISDIHGNTEALKKVIEELDGKVEKIICLGDMISGTPKSEQVVKLIMDLKDKVIAVRGNRENYIIEGIPKIIHDEKIKVSKEEQDRVKWEKEQLSENSIDFLSNMLKEQYIEIEDKKIYAVHYPMKEDSKYRTHIKRANVEGNEIMFKGIEADIYLYGHTHTEICNRKLNKLYVNPGALGCPEGSNYARFGILEIEKEKVEYTQMKVEYDVNEVINYINNIKPPCYKRVLKLFFGVEENYETNY